MYSTLNTNNTQNFWCRNKYCQHLNTLYHIPIFKETHGCVLIECKSKSTECRGAHDEKSIKVLPSIYKFNSMKKNTIDWVKLYLDIINAIESNKIKIHNPDYKQKTSDLTRYNFIELIQLWRDLACYYRKIAKSLPSKLDFSGVSSEEIDGYKFKDDVPEFYLSDNFEDITWPFERLTRKCPVQNKFNDCVKKNILITIWDVCLATGLNCKEGVHKPNESICSDDFLNGSCKCLTVEQISEQVSILEKQILELEKQVSDTSWSVKKNKKKINNDPNSLIFSIRDKIDNLNNSRPIHYTELGMIPFNIQYQNYILVEQRKVEEQKIIEQKEIELLNKPVIKLVKFGKK